MGRLRDSEVERINDKVGQAVIETLLAMTIFRQDFTVGFFASFVVLSFVKIFHWMVQDRVDFIETTPNVTRSQHLRIIAFIFLLIGIDYALLRHALASTLSKGISINLLFAFEYAIQASTAVTTLAKYFLSVADMWLEGRWEGKGVAVFYLDLTLDLLHLITYSAFFAAVFSTYGIPIHLVRDLYWTFRNFQTRVRDFLRYRRVAANMDRRFPDATPEDLERADHVCIVCREEMRAGSRAKKLDCSHTFHLHCLRSWLERQQNCPICRTPVLATAPVAVAGGAGGGRHQQHRDHRHHHHNQQQQQREDEEDQRLVEEVGAAFQRMFERDAELMNNLHLRNERGERQEQPSTGDGTAGAAPPPQQQQQQQHMMFMNGFSAAIPVIPVPILIPIMVPQQPPEPLPRPTSSSTGEPQQQQQQPTPEQHAMASAIAAAATAAAMYSSSPSFSFGSFPHPGVGGAMAPMSFPMNPPQVPVQTNVPPSGSGGGDSETRVGEEEEKGKTASATAPEVASSSSSQKEEEETIEKDVTAPTSDTASASTPLAESTGGPQEELRRRRLEKFNQTASSNGTD